MYYNSDDEIDALKDKIKKLEDELYWSERKVAELEGQIQDLKYDNRILRASVEEYRQERMNATDMLED